MNSSRATTPRPDSITIDTESAGEGSLLMFRDSFGELLYPYLAAEFGSARFSRQAAYDLTTAASLGSDTVVIELVERKPALFDRLCRHLPPRPSARSTPPPPWTRARACRSRPRRPPAGC